MNKCLVSVILPIYNVGEYLEKCLNTVVNQHYQNIEIILIDDGSTDNSGEICDKFAENDKRIIVCHQSNKGLVYSWKKALTIAKGEWIAFVDPDDYIGNDYLTCMVDAAKKFNVDMVVAPSKKVYRDTLTNIKSELKPGIYVGNKYKRTVLENLLSNGYFQDRLLPPNRWGKLIRKRDLLTKIRYVDDSVTYGEDLNIMFLVFLEIGSIAVLERTEDNCYFYRTRETSMINDYDRNRWESVKKVYKSLNKVLLDKANEIPYNSLHDQLVMDCSAAFVQSYKNEFKNPQFKLNMLNSLIYDMRCQDIYVDIKHKRYLRYGLLQRLILFDIVKGNRITHFIMYLCLKVGVIFRKRR